MSGEFFIFQQDSAQHHILACNFVKCSPTLIFTARRYASAVGPLYAVVLCLSSYFGNTELKWVNEICSWLPLWLDGRKGCTEETLIAILRTPALPGAKQQ